MYVKYKSQNNPKKSYKYFTLPSKVYILVQCPGLLVEGLVLYKTLKEAKKGFKMYTSFSHDLDYNNFDSPDYSEDFEQTKIIEIDFNKPQGKQDTIL